MIKRVFWPLVVAVISTILAIWLFPVTLPPYLHFYPGLAGTNIHLKVFWIWIDLLVSFAITYVIASMFVLLPIARFRFSLHFNQTKITGIAASSLWFLIRIYVMLNETVNWTLFTIVYWGSLLIAECTIIYVLMHKLGSAVRRTSTKSYD